MKNVSSLSRRISAAALLALLCTSLATPVSLFASGGATDPIPGTSKSGLKSGGTGGGGGGGGGGGKSSGTVTTTTTTVPVQPLVTGVLNFTAAASVNDVIPLCTGSYHIDPYYPTLSLMTVDVKVSSMNVPDGTSLYITVNGSAGSALYPFTSNVIPVVAQSGTCSYNVYVSPGTTISSVIIADAAGTVISAGN